jgi:hypothetical protein
MLVYDFWNNLNPFELEGYSERCIVLGNHKQFSGNNNNKES